MGFIICVLVKVSLLAIIDGARLVSSAELSSSASWQKPKERKRGVKYPASRGTRLEVLTWKKRSIPSDIVVKPILYIFPRLVNIFLGYKILHEDSTITLDEVEDVLERGIGGDVLDFWSILLAKARHVGKSLTHSNLETESGAKFRSIANWP
jgi:hypothetical protein